MKRLNIAAAGVLGETRTSGLIRRCTDMSRMITSVFCALMASSQLVFAEDIWTTFQHMMNDIYLKLLGITTIIAITMAVVALLMRMMSKNQQTINEANRWLKNIAICYFAINLLGAIIAYVQPLIQGGQYQVDSGTGTEG